MRSIRWEGLVGRGVLLFFDVPGVKRWKSGGQSGKRERLFRKKEWKIGAVRENLWRKGGASGGNGGLNRSETVEFCFFLRVYG